MSGFYSHVVRRFFPARVIRIGLGFIYFICFLFTASYQCSFLVKLIFFNVVIQEISEDIKSRHCDRFFIESISISLLY